MPIYEFVCQSCENEFERIQSFSDSSVPVCIKCQSTKVVRLMGRPAIHFKGSGWYINDSKKSVDKESKSNAKVAEDGSETKQESKQDGKQESNQESSQEGNQESKSKSTTESKSDGATETKAGSEKKSESSTTTPSTPTPVAAD